MRVPIIDKFQNDRMIGYAEIDEDKLPLNPNWHLALGYVANDKGAYTLICFGLVNDTLFMSDLSKNKEG